MTLDHWLVARLAKDLDALLRGSRIQSLSATDTGIVFFCYRRGTDLALRVSVDSNAPLVAAYELPNAAKENGSHGWAGGVAALLRGSTVDAVSAVPNDRVLYVDVSSRSAFGVPSRSRIVVELQPRKANALVLRSPSSDEWLIVAAAKQFDGAEDARSVKTGERYVPPPPRRARLDRAKLIIAVGDLAEGDEGRLARLLGEYDPDCTPALAREVIFRTQAAGPAVSARELIDRWSALRHEVEEALEESRDAFVAYKEGKVAGYHLVPLGWMTEAGASAPSVAPLGTAMVKTLNEICVAELVGRPEVGHGPSLAALRKKLSTMLARCRDEVAGLETARVRADEAVGLRAAGDEIYAHLTEIAAGAAGFVAPDGREVSLDPLLTPKENAAEYFRKYKKARSGLPRIAARLRVLRANREYWEQLQWELDWVEGRGRAERDALLVEIATAVGVKQQRAKGRRPQAQERRFELSGGAVALVGRSPKDNERLTFSVAAPGDLWFHARGIPGAHVIVKTGGLEISTQQVEEAAALAAGHSRAADAASVEVDYTARKHVRRHSSGRPGLVWYTEFKTVRVRPHPG